MPRINVDTFDRFTLGHAAVGVLLGLAGASKGQALAAAVAWELAENPLKDAFPGAFPHPSHDTRRNAVGDVIGVMAGWWLARLAGAEERRATGRERG